MCDTPIARITGCVSSYIYHFILKIHSSCEIEQFVVHAKLIFASSVWYSETWGIYVYLARVYVAFFFYSPSLSSLSSHPSFWPPTSQLPPPLPDSLTLRRTEILHPPDLAKNIIHLLFFSRFSFPAFSGQSVVTGVVPSPFRYLALNFIAPSVRQSHCSSIFHRVLLTHALALFVKSICARKKFQQI